MGQLQERAAERGDGGFNIVRHDGDLWMYFCLVWSGLAAGKEIAEYRSDGISRLHCKHRDIFLSRAISHTISDRPNFLDRKPSIHSRV